MPSFFPPLALALGTLLFALGLAAPASAQNLEDQVRQLKRDVEDLQRQVFTGEAPSTAPRPAAPAAEGIGPATQVRVDEIEQQLRVLTGKVEELQFSVNRTMQRLDALSGDVELRFQDLTDRLDGLESGGAATASTAAEPALEAPTSEDSQTLGTVVVPGGAEEALPETAGESYRRAYGLVIAGRYDQAEAELERYLELFGETDRAANAQYWLAETHYARKQFEDAAREFAAGLQTYPEGAKAADNLLKLGLSLAAMGEKEKACIALGELNVRHPGAAPRILERGSAEQRRLGC